MVMDEQVEAVAWAILQALHENVPEKDRPMSWSDLKGDQDQRVRSAAVAAIECIAHRPCTCHPDDWPQHIPCQHKYAFKDCAVEAIRQNLAMIK